MIVKLSVQVGGKLYKLDREVRPMPPKPLKRFMKKYISRVFVPLVIRWMEAGYSGQTFTNGIDVS